MPDINRPHIAALLRVIADEVVRAGAVSGLIAEPDIQAEANRLINDVVSRLRQRADEIEGRT